MRIISLAMLLQAEGSCAPLFYPPLLSYLLLSSLLSAPVPSAALSLLSSTLLSPSSPPPFLSSEQKGGITARAFDAAGEEDRENDADVVAVIKRRLRRERLREKQLGAEESTSCRQKE